MPQTAIPQIAKKPTPKKVEIGQKLKGLDKTVYIPIKAIDQPLLKKPEWIRAQVGGSSKFHEVKKLLRQNNLHTVCEEASCPNIGECFSKGTATFMIMGDICTRRCPFCDVGTGRPNPLDEHEPHNLADAVAKLKLSYVVITSVDRDDVQDGGAAHFVACIEQVKHRNPEIQIEVLTPDFKNKLDYAVPQFLDVPLDVFNHNLETVPRLYKKNRPGASYEQSLLLLQKIKQARPSLTTKSGIMVGLGETKQEVFGVLEDMRDHQIDIATIGQYLSPTKYHLPVERFVHPDEFAEYYEYGMSLGFSHVASGPLVRSSYHADEQFETSASHA